MNKEKKTKLKSKDIKVLAKDTIKHARDNQVFKSVQEIEHSKHPEKECHLCGTKGCDKKYNGYYLHNKCFRKIKNNTFNMLAKKVIGGK